MTVSALPLAPLAQEHAKRVEAHWDAIIRAKLTPQHLAVRCRTLATPRYGVQRVTRAYLTCSPMPSFAVCGLCAAC